MSELDNLEEIDLSAPTPTKPQAIKGTKRARALGRRGLARFPKWKQELYASQASKKPISLKTKEG
jgi:hypothetical protein